MENKIRSMCTACLCNGGSRHVRSMLPLRWNPSKYLQTDPETRSNPCGIGTRSQATAIDPPISIARKMHKDKLNINAPVSTMQPGNLSEQKWGCDPSTRASNMGDSFGTCAVNGKHQTVRETIVQETGKHQTSLGDCETSKQSPEIVKHRTISPWDSVPQSIGSGRQLLHQT